MPKGIFRLSAISVSLWFNSHRGRLSVHPLIIFASIGRDWAARNQCSDLPGITPSGLLGGEVFAGHLTFFS